MERIPGGNVSQRIGLGIQLFRGSRAPLRSTRSSMSFLRSSEWRGQTQHPSTLLLATKPDLLNQDLQPREHIGEPMARQVSTPNVR
jgi:hypothetical protein